MKVLRVADVDRTRTAGVSGCLFRGGDALGELDDTVEYLFALDIVGVWMPLRLRRVTVPFAVCAKVWRRVRRSHVDVVELHEHLAAPYSVLTSVPLLRRHLPPCAVFSHGLVERQCQIAMQLESGSSRYARHWKRTSVLLTLVIPARVAHRYADQVLVLNTADRDQLVHTESLGAARVSLVSNGVEPEFFNLRRHPQGTLRVLFVGTWLARKGVRELVASWRLVMSKRNDLRLTVAGTHMAGEEIRGEFHEVGMSVEVIPRFDRERLLELFADHDVLVLPSWSEGMPLAALEAAASGLAVIASRVPGNVDIFRPPDPESDGGVLFSAGSSAELAEAIERVADDRELVEVLGARARERAAEFSWERAARELHSAYEQAVTSAKARLV